MRYGWDKIKLVTDDLKLWDNLQVLWFDTCGFALIWKWNNEYWTYWDPLNSSETPCWTDWNCPNCQPKVRDIKNLPGWPNPCSDWDAFLMITKTGNLKTICESNFNDKNDKVRISAWDETPWYLKKKLIVCDDDWPITLEEVTSGWVQALCIWFDPEKTQQKLVNLADWPGRYPTTQWVLIWTHTWWDWAEPNSECSTSRYQYLAYDTKAKTMKMMCDKVTSLASWTFQWWYVSINTNDWTKLKLTNRATTSKPTETLVLMWWSHDYWSTEDIKKSPTNEEYIFEITTPWVYTITANCTIHNRTEAWVQAIRWWLKIAEWSSSEYEVWDAKFDWRKYTEYVTDTPMWQVWWEKNLELSIMSFNTVYIKAFPNASVDAPVKVWFAVSIDTNLNDAKMSQQQRDNLAAHKIEIWFTDGTEAMWPKTVISCVRNWDVPSSYKQR